MMPMKDIPELGQLKLLQHQVLNYLQQSLRDPYHPTCILRLENFSEQSQQHVLQIPGHKHLTNKARGSKQNKVDRNTTKAVFLFCT